MRYPSPHHTFQDLLRFALISKMTKNSGKTPEFRGSVENFTACTRAISNALLIESRSSILPTTNSEILQNMKHISHVLHCTMAYLRFTPWYLGDSRLIPGMADFSQGYFLQSVSRVKKKSQCLQTYPKLVLKCNPKHKLFPSKN